MANHNDGHNFVTDDNTGGHFVFECGNCGHVGSSANMQGGEPIGFEGDYGDCYCPKCNDVDPDECTNAALVWNVQQRKINELEQKLLLIESERDNAIERLTQLNRALDVALKKVDEISTIYPLPNSLNNTLNKVSELSTTFETRERDTK